MRSAPTVDQRKNPAIAASDSQIDAPDRGQAGPPDRVPSHFAEGPRCFRRDDHATGRAIGSPDGGHTFSPETSHSPHAGDARTDVPVFVQRMELTDQGRAG